MANWGIAKEIQKYVQEKIGTLGWHIMHVYNHNTLIPKVLEIILNGTTKSQLLENYGFAKLRKYTVGEWLINIGFKYDYVAKN